MPQNTSLTWWRQARPSKHSTKAARRLLKDVSTEDIYILAKVIKLYFEAVMAHIVKSVECHKPFKCAGNMIVVGLVHRCHVISVSHSLIIYTSPCLWADARQTCLSFQWPIGLSPSSWSVLRLTGVSNRLEKEKDQQLHGKPKPSVRIHTLSSHFWFFSTNHCTTDNGVMTKTKCNTQDSTLIYAKMLLALHHLVPCLDVPRMDLVWISRPDLTRPGLSARCLNSRAREKPSLVLRIGR